MADSPPPKRHNETVLPYIVLVAIGLIALVSWLVLSKMREISRIQDCEMQGRRNCA